MPRFHNVSYKSIATYAHALHLLVLPGTFSVLLHVQAAATQHVDPPEASCQSSMATVIDTLLACDMGCIGNSTAAEGVACSAQDTQTCRVFK